MQKEEEENMLPQAYKYTFVKYELQENEFCLEALVNVLNEKINVLSESQRRLHIQQIRVADQTTTQRVTWKNAVT